MVADVVGLTEPANTPGASQAGKREFGVAKNPARPPVLNGGDEPRRTERVGTRWALCWTRPENWR
jgi:hypothetical protein